MLEHNMDEADNRKHEESLELDHLEWYELGGAVTSLCFCCTKAPLRVAGTVIGPDQMVTGGQLKYPFPSNTSCISW